jgi:hypothetical protein
MNLRVDLILESERRSASMINTKSIMRIAAIVGPVLLVVLISGFAFNIWQLKNHLDSLNKTLEVELPKKEKALKIRAELNANIQILSEIEGWQKSRIDWADQLVGIQKEIPDKMQLENMTVSHSIVITNFLPARLYSMTLSGQAVGDTAQTLVMQLKGSLPKSSVLSNFFAASPNVTRFSGPLVPNETNKNDRLFQMDCSYKPRMFQ